MKSREGLSLTNSHNLMEAKQVRRLRLAYYQQASPA